MDWDTVAPLVATADTVFHLAAAVGVRLVVEQPVHTIQTNIGTTETVLALAAERRSRVLLASTSEVYGKLDGHRFSENDDVVLGPTSRSRWSYAASKIIEEFRETAYARERDIPVTIMRLFNTIGPRQPGSTAWWCLGSCSRPFRASHSRCMGTGRSVAPSRGWETS